MLSLRITDMSLEEPVSYELQKENCAILLVDGVLKANVSSVYNQDDSAIEDVAKAIEKSPRLKVELVFGEKITKTFYGVMNHYRISVDESVNEIVENLEINETV